MFTSVAEQMVQLDFQCRFSDDLFHAEVWKLLHVVPGVIFDTDSLQFSYLRTTCIFRSYILDGVILIYMVNSTSYFILFASFILE